MGILIHHLHFVLAHLGIRAGGRGDQHKQGGNEYDGILSHKRSRNVADKVY